MAAKSVLEGGPGGHEHHDSRAGDVIEAEIDEFKCRRIDPMRVLEHEQDGLAARQLYELLDERLQSASPLLLWRQAQGFVTSFDLQSKQRGKQGPVTLGTNQHLFQAIELIVVVVVGLDPGGEHELLNDRIKR